MIESNDDTRTKSGGVDVVHEVVKSVGSHNRYTTLALLAGALLIVWLSPGCASKTVDPLGSGEMLTRPQLLAKYEARQREIDRKREQIVNDANVMLSVLNDTTEDELAQFEISEADLDRQDEIKASVAEFAQGFAEVSGVPLAPVGVGLLAPLLLGVGADNLRKGRRIRELNGG